MSDSDTPAVEIRVGDIAQLFDNLDPFPFRERDLDAAAEEYIVGSVQDLPAGAPIRIVVHAPAAAAASAAGVELEGAVRRFFAYRADVAGRELKELFRAGRLSLAIGLAVLAVCLVVGEAVAGRFGSGHVGRFVEEGLIIVGWVANWRPLEIFLYDWWPLAARRHLYRRLAAASVVVRPGAAPAPPPAAASGRSA